MAKGSILISLREILGSPSCLASASSTGLSSLPKKPTEESALFWLAGWFQVKLFLSFQRDRLAGHDARRQENDQLGLHAAAVAASKEKSQDRNPAQDGHGGVGSFPLVFDQTPQHHGDSVFDNEARLRFRKAN